MAKKNDPFAGLGSGSLALPTASIKEMTDSLYEAQTRLGQFQRDLAGNPLAGGQSYFEHINRQVHQIQKGFDEARRRAAYMMRVIKEGRFAASLGEGIDKANKLRDSMSGVGRQAAIAFATATTSLTAFVAASSPDAINTFTGSLQLVTMQLGQAFIPYMKEASRWLQDVYKWFGSLSQEQKANAARWVMWGVAALGIIMILPKIISLVGGLMVAIRALGTALTTLAANPVIATLVALGVAITAVGTAFALSSTQAEKMDAVNQRLAGGSMGGKDLLQNTAYWNLKDITDHKKRAAAAEFIIRREEDNKFALPAGSPEDKRKWAADSDAQIAVARKFRDYANQGKMFDPFRNKSHRTGDDMLLSMQGAQPSYQSLNNAYQSIQMNALGKDPMQAKILEEQQKGNKLHAEGNEILNQIKDKAALPAVVP